MSKRFNLILKGQNKSGTTFGIEDCGNDKFRVWKLCSNYNGRLKGGVERIWRYVSNLMVDQKIDNIEGKTSKGFAVTLYRKRLLGTQK